MSASGLDTWVLGVVDADNKKNKILGWEKKHD